MASRVRNVTLVLSLLVLFIGLAFFSFEHFSSQVVHANSLRPSTTCTRGANCGGRNPIGLSDAQGSCTSGNVVEGTSGNITDAATGTQVGTMLILYNHNCDVWYGDAILNFGPLTLDTSINNAAQDVFHSYSGVSGDVNTYTLYDGASQTTVFACAMSDGSSASGCASSSTS